MQLGMIGLGRMGANMVAPLAFSLTRSLTTLRERSNTTHSCPFFSSRRTPRYVYSAESRSVVILVLGI
jgi:3-hydroxyisobutyrate dehydrogenase-like beta-hydroxyacid dehydrogenase